MTEEQVPVRDRSARRRIVIVGAVVPIAIAVVAAAAMLSWLPELPDPIAIHWSGHGPDGFGPAGPMIFLPLGIVAVFSLFSVGSSLANAHGSAVTWTQKFLVVTSLWLSTLLSVGIAGGVAVQRGLADAREAPDVGLWLAIGAIAGLALAVAAWFLLPRAEAVDETGASPRPLDLQGQERVSWSRPARLGTAATAVILLTFALILATTVFVIAAAREASAIVIAVLVLVVVLVATNTWWRVTADHRGFIARGVLGWPRKHIAAEDIRSVQVVDVNPSRDFGGWGWRWAGNGRSGIILRAGEAIEVTRRNGRRFVVTVDDAKTGAGVLAAIRAGASAEQ